MPARALVVEDNEANQGVIAAILQVLDLEITFANDGVEALERVAADKYDVILIDIHMPLMDGFEATIKDTGVGRLVCRGAHHCGDCE